MECKLLYSLKYSYSILLKQVVPSPRVLSRSFVLSYKILGEGMTDPEEPPVFVFHGLLFNKRHWEGIGKTILNLTKRCVVVVDLRNHGDSPHLNSHKYEEQAADILHLFDKLGVTQASLIGHSIGGKAAMCVALSQPMRVAGLLVVDISPVSVSKQYQNNYPKVLAAMKAVTFKKPTTVTEARKEALTQLKDLVTDDFLLKTIVSNIKEKTDGTIGWSLNIDTLIRQFQHIVTFPQTMKVKKYYGPTLFVGGQLSEFIPPDDLIPIREMFPKAVITYINKTGHYLHHDDPRSFLEITISFIRKHHFKRTFKAHPAT
ncbi:unnamed protein product [Chrysodeixis includens]|uniref:sn-1-specific diacylglycerol lipase ABHD11 n=1 Tax=Chrysodeixis includens TaxID=689277 RepID=A0A9P0BYH0_CHRIL|nr:unnamed protein product [Chrysodeixis includens]